MVGGRALYNGMKFQHFYYECAKHQTWDVPWLFVPARVLVSLAHPETVIGFRIQGTTIYILIIAVLSSIVKLLFNRVQCLHVTAAMTALLSLGVFPYAMVRMRPESSLALAILLALLLFLLSRKVQSKYQYITLGLLFLLDCSWFLSTHPKAVLYFPAIAVMAVLFRTDSQLIRYCYLVIVTCMCLQSTVMWKNYIHCEGSQRIERLHTQHALNQIDALWKSPNHVWDVVQKNISKANLYIDGHLFKKIYHPTDSKGKELKLFKYFPEQAFSNYKWNGLLNFLIKTLVYCSVIAAVTGIILIISNFTRYVGPLSQMWVLVAFLPSIGALIAVKSSIIEYEPVFIWAQLALLAAVALLNVQNNYLRMQCGAAVLSLIVLISLCSQIYAAHHLFQYYNVFSQKISVINSQKISEAQKLSVASISQSMSNIIDKKDDIRGLAQDCGIKNSDRDLTLIVDSITYMPLHSFLVKHLIIDIKRHNSPIPYRLYLEQPGSLGIVMLCRNMPKYLLSAAIRSGNVCCVSSDFTQPKR